MHEWSLASSIVLTTKKILAEKGYSKLNGIDIVVGELSQIDLDILRDALRTLLGEEFGEGVEVNIEVEKARLKCNTCGYEFGFREVWDQLKQIFCQDIEPGEECENPVHYVPELVSSFVKCPKCGSVDLEIISGRGVWIKSLKVGEEK